MKPVPPCYQCETRRPGCHSPAACAAWAEFEEKKRAFYDERDAARNKTEIEASYVRKRHTQMIRRERYSNRRK